MFRLDDLLVFFLIFHGLFCSVYLFSVQRSKRSSRDTMEVASADTVHWLFVDRVYALIAVAVATCTIYDHITTLDEEIELVWKRRKWTLVQVFFFINRYTGGGLQIYTAFVLVRHIAYNTEESCNFLGILQGYLATLVAATMQGIMVYRVSSMYNHQRSVIIMLASAFLSEIVALVVIQVIATDTPAGFPDPAPGVHLCKQDNMPTWTWVNWMPIALFEALVLILSLSLAIKYYNSTKHNPTAMHSFRNSLGYILFRDSITFPLINVVICVANIFAWIHPPYLAGQIAFSFAVLAPCIIGSRLILNLREAYYHPFVEECQSPEDETPEVGLDIIDIR
ncbi:hypothetical protein CVT26_001744 [Gymnopilus dilepis]|uniref:DUF6533 domain-containing protein n=1 Tax=Gymnopilus dilepis TaxID=231916 RepID=A0A409WB28_9AGAR|nr:hypothetical protein CVT26_001744 [Gymnopilus dilepis]